MSNVNHKSDSCAQDNAEKASTQRVYVVGPVAFINRALGGEASAEAQAVINSELGKIAERLSEAQGHEYGKIKGAISRRAHMNEGQTAALLSKKDAARFLGISVRSLLRYAKSQGLTVSYINGRAMFAASQLENLRGGIIGAFARPESAAASFIRDTMHDGLKWAVWERDDFRCLLCGVRRYLTIDHINPVSAGGLTTALPQNSQTDSRYEATAKSDSKVASTPNS